MTYRIERLISSVMVSIDHLDRREWIVISAIAVVVGAFLLRGYGSRTNY